jgi:hypothetical protein
VFERSWFYRCLEVPGATEETDCRFRIWKDKSGRYMDRQTVRILLEKGETDELEGFAARDGRTYNARLTLEDGEVVIHGVAGSSGERVTEAPEYDVNDEPLGLCPMGCGSQVVETATHFQCQAGIAKAAANAEQARAFEESQPKDAKRRKRYKPAPEDQPCPFLLPRTVCKREITRAEALQFIGPNKKTELLTDFTSRFGRPFSAMLFLKENGRHGFEFQRGRRKRRARPPRAWGAGATSRAMAARGRGIGGGPPRSAKRLKVCIAGCAQARGAEQRRPKGARERRELVRRIGLVQQAVGDDLEKSLARRSRAVPGAADRGAARVSAGAVSPRYFPQVEDVALRLAEFHPRADHRAHVEARGGHRHGVDRAAVREAAGLYHSSAVVFSATARSSPTTARCHSRRPCSTGKFYFAPGDVGFHAVDTSAGRIGV